MKAIIFGITGQDGSYLAEFLLSRGYEVHGITRQTSGDQYDRINHIIHRLNIHKADLSDQISLIQILEKIRPDEIYNLAAFSLPATGWKQPELCGQINALAVVRILEAIRLVDPDIKFFQASSREIFGQPAESPQTEMTPVQPESPHGISKLYSQLMVKSYREKYGLHACCGILYDHDSPRRNPECTTRKITHAAARIKLGLQKRLHLSNLALRRDWGFAGDYVRVFWMMLQYPTPDDYIVASGHSHNLEDYCRHAFSAVDLDWHDYVIIDDDEASKPAETSLLLGNTGKARRKLLWEPEVSFKDMIKMMVDVDIARLAPKNRLRFDNNNLPFAGITTGQETMKVETT